MTKNENNPATLTAKQLAAIESLLTEKTTKAAAKSAGVSETTVWRWLQQPLFANAYKEARNRILEVVLTNLQAASKDAVKTLRDTLTDKEAKASEKVSAARAILEFTFKGKEVLETEERLRVLEESLQPMNRRKTF